MFIVYTHKAGRSWNHQSNGNYVRRFLTVDSRGVTFIFLWSRGMNDVFVLFFLISDLPLCSVLRCLFLKLKNEWTFKIDTPWLSQFNYANSYTKEFLYYFWISDWLIIFFIFKCNPFMVFESFIAYSICRVSLLGIS